MRLAQHPEGYITDRRVPDTTVDLLDAGRAHKHLRQMAIPREVRELGRAHRGLFISACCGPGSAVLGSASGSRSLAQLRPPAAGPSAS